ncbi:MAG: alkaline phosphatase [Woeseiaceae bacterium]
MQQLISRAPRHIVLFSLFVAALAGCASSPSNQVQSGRAENIILFIGDGMGVSTVTAARIFDGQSQGKSGEEHVLPFERFDHVALVKTYNTNQQVADSAGTATAMLSGDKTRAGVIGIGSKARRRNCKDALENPLESIGEIAKRRGKEVGVVTTTRITHATPASLYAHTPERDWESDQFLPADDWAAGCRDIAWQLLNSVPEGGLDIAMGGGRATFYGGDHGGSRLAASDDLVSAWLAGDPARRFIDTAAALDGIQSDQQVLGLFSRSHMTYVAERDEDSTEPTLSQMTAAAIDRLATSAEGYFLLVEGGRIDHGHHIGKPAYAMLEAQAFARAVETAIQKVDLEETLILVTADHSHVFTMGGYATRGNPILGLVVTNDKTGSPNAGPARASDGKTYRTVQYANGPGATPGLPRQDPELGVDSLAQALIPLRSENIDGTVTNDETHGGEDVALYAAGAGADAVRGVIEQNRIFDIMMSAFGQLSAR